MLNFGFWTRPFVDAGLVFTPHHIRSPLLLIQIPSSAAPFYIPLDISLQTSNYIVFLLIMIYVLWHPNVRSHWINNPDIMAYVGGLPQQRCPSMESHRMGNIHPQLKCMPSPQPLILYMWGPLSCFRCLLI